MRPFGAAGRGATVVVVTRVVVVDERVVVEAIGSGITSVGRLPLPHDRLKAAVRVTIATAVLASFTPARF